MKRGNKKRHTYPGHTILEVIISSILLLTMFLFFSMLISKMLTANSHAVRVKAFVRSTLPEDILFRKREPDYQLVSPDIQVQMKKTEQSGFYKIDVSSSTSGGSFLHYYYLPIQDTGDKKNFF